MQKSKVPDILLPSGQETSKQGLRTALFITVHWKGGLARTPLYRRFIYMRVQMLKIKGIPLRKWSLPSRGLRRDFHKKEDLTEPPDSSMGCFRNSDGTHRHCWVHGHTRVICCCHSPSAPLGWKSVFTMAEFPTAGGSKSVHTSLTKFPWPWSDDILTWFPPSQLASLPSWSHWLPFLLASLGSGHYTWPSHELDSGVPSSWQLVQCSLLSEESGVGEGWWDRPLRLSSSSTNSGKL